MRIPKLSICRWGVDAHVVGKSAWVAVVCWVVVGVAVKVVVAGGEADGVFGYPATNAGAVVSSAVIIEAAFLISLSAGKAEQVIDRRARLVPSVKTQERRKALV